MSMLFKPFITTNNFEERFVLAQLNGIFYKKKGHVFKIPPKNSPVVLLLSGGMDSVFLWYILLKKYGLNVYPIHLYRSRFFDGQRRSISFFSWYFKKNFPGHYHTPKYFYRPPALFSFSRDGSKNIVDLPFFLKNASLNKATGELKVVMINNPSRLWMYLSYGYEYCLLLKTLGVDAYTFFIGLTPDDTTISRESTLSVLRSLNVAMCYILDDWRYQVTALIEKKAGFFFSKKDSVLIAREESFPLYKSWSCDRGMLFHCGLCGSCRMRQMIFQQAGVVDKTFYFINLSRRIFLQRITAYIRNIQKRIVKSQKRVALLRNISFTQSNVDTCVFALKSTVLTHTVNGKTYLINKELGQFLETNQVGASIVRLLQEGGKTYKQLHTALRHMQYRQIKVGILKRDVLSFLKLLAGAGLLDINKPF